MNTFSEGSAVKKLRDNGIIVEEESEKKRIKLRADQQVGLKMWSAIDYLCANHGYKWMRGTW